MTDHPASSFASRIVEFGDCTLDVAARELVRGGQRVSLQPKAFDVLVYLVSERDRVVTKDELLERLWPGEVVSESSLTFSIKAVRRAVGDDGASQRILKTSHGRGYRFVADVREAGVSPSADEAAATAGRSGDTTAATIPEDDRAASDVRRPGERSEARRPIQARDRILLQTAATSFVGREDERRHLDGELARARSGETRTVFVLGDPGVGKTRLVAELAANAEAAGDTVLVGRCYEGTPPAFWPWVQVVRSFVEQQGRDAARAVAGDSLPDIARLVPGLLDAEEEARLVRTPGEAEAEHARLRLFDSLVGFLREASRTRPVVVVLDDLHWADASSLLLLRHLVRELLDSRLLVLGTYRHVEVKRGGALSELLGWLHRTKRSMRLRLHGLTDEEVAVLVRDLAGAEPSGELVSALGRVTDGNPFFVEEFCRDLVDRGAFEGDAALTADCIRIPEEVRDVLLQRVARLGDAAKDILAVAAVLGREFRYDDLLAAAGGGEGAVVAALEAAEASGLVQSEPGSPGNFVFVHALVSEVLYNGLGSLRRAQLHRSVGTVIEARSGGDPLLRAAELAHHFSGAVAVGEAAKAFACERAAGDLYVERFAYEDAAVHYERALRLARDGACDEDARFELLLAMSRATFRHGEDARSREILLEAVVMARASGSPIRLARAALRTATLFPVTPRERVALLEEALAGLRALIEVDPRLLAGVLSALASGLYGKADAVDRREALVDEALEMARSSGDRRTILHVLTASQVALWRPGYLDRRLALSREHVDVAEQGSDLVERASARTWYIPALLEKGSVAEADRQIELIDREAAESRMLVYRANALSFRAMRALTRGAFDEVEFLAQRSYELARRYNETTASMTLWSQLYYTRREQGRLAEIEAGIHLFAQQVTQVSWDWLLLHLYCEDERSEDALPMLERVVESGLDEGMPGDSHIVFAAALFGMSEAVWRLKHAEGATLLLPHLERYRDQWVTVGLGGVCLGSVAYCHGLALATLGRREEAVAALEHAEREHEREGLLLPLLRTRAELGSVLLAARSGDSRRRARELLASTAAEARRLGLVQLQRVIEGAGA